MNEGPAPVEDRGAQHLRHIERGQAGSAECRHQQDELKIGHVGTINIERLHGRRLSRKPQNTFRLFRASVKDGVAQRSV